MPRYECPNCHRVSCGWVIKYKYRNKCPGCGGELRRLPDSDNEEFREVEGNLKGDSEDSLSKILSLDI
ncbi:hypothetical protein ES705_25541 [subsurface metagenome]